jgi:hypothetical protein
MLPALSTATAASGTSAQSQRVEGIAQVVTALGASAPAGTTQAATQVTPSAPVRLGALPVGDTPEESLMTLAEAKHAYRMNAAALATADDALDTLLHTLGGK